MPSSTLTPAYMPATGRQCDRTILNEAPYPSKAFGLVQAIEKLFLFLGKLDATSHIQLYLEWMPPE